MFADVGVVIVFIENINSEITVRVIIAWMDDNGTRVHCQLQGLFASMPVVRSHAVAIIHS